MIARMDEWVDEYEVREGGMIPEVVREGFQEEASYT